MSGIFQAYLHIYAVNVNQCQIIQRYESEYYTNNYKNVS